MDKPAENRRDSSADNKKSEQSPHLSDEQLLFDLDGELSADESALVDVHLEACWSCRARREKIEEAIATIVEYRDLLVSSSLPSSNSGRAMFIARLQELGRSIGKPSLRSRIVGTLRALQVFSKGSHLRLAGIGAVVIATLILLLFTQPWEVRKVSANQLFENAQASEVRALHSIASPVVYQKLSIRMGDEAVTRTIYRDVGGMRQADRLDVTAGSGKLAGNGLLARSQEKRGLEDVQNAKDEIEQTFVHA